MKETFWTDNEAVLGYIANESRKFKIFVVNRVEMIKEGSDPSQWFYVNSKENPADYSSRGVKTNNVNAVKMWFEGPSFLWRSTSTWNIDNLKGRLSPEDPEVKKEAHVYVTSLKDDILSRLEKRISNWNKMKRIVGMVLQYKYKLLSKVRSTDHSTDNNNHYFQAAEEEIIRMVQKRRFQREINAMNMGESNVKLKKDSTIYNLDTFMGADGLIRVGGRLKHSHLNNSCKHPVLLPKEEKVTDLVFEWCHARCAHGRRGATLNELRRSGYWVVKGNSAVRSKLFKCVQCRRLRRKLCIQKMANLPSSRLMEVPPFTYCGVDMFGPFIIRQRRSEVKRCGAMFTCMNSRAVHIEVTHSLDTDSFILALRRMIARRVNVRTIYSDNGSNFIGAENELKKALEEMDDKKIQAFVQEFGGDWIK